MNRAKFQQKCISIGDLPIISELIFHFIFTCSHCCIASCWNKKENFFPIIISKKKKKEKTIIFLFMSLSFVSNLHKREYVHVHVKSEWEREKIRRNVCTWTISLNFRKRGVHITKSWNKQWRQFSFCCFFFPRSHTKYVLKPIRRFSVYSHFVEFINKKKEERRTNVERNREKDETIFHHRQKFCL